MTAIRAGLDRLESQAMPASAVTLDLEALSAADRAFIAKIGPRCETDSGKPDYSLLSAPELRRLIDIARQYARPA